MVNSLPNDKILDLSKLKAFAVDKKIVTQNSEVVLEILENIVGKGENAGYQNFLPIPRGFQKFFFLRVIKSRDCVVSSYMLAYIRTRLSVRTFK